MADTDDARLIWELYAAALKHVPAERSGYLERACTDPRLRARVASLLESHGLDLGQDTRLESPTPFAAAGGTGFTGRQIGTYVILRELGRGGMGVVFLAHDMRLSRTVAIKMLSPEYSRAPQVRERLLNEAKMAAALSHPGIATVYALDEIDGELYLACEYVPGAPLRALVESGPLPIDEVIDIGTQLAKALAEAHTKGIVHRDIKPENVIKTPSGVIKVLDFGLARAEYAPTHLTVPGMLVGTPAYLAPEQALGRDTDFRTDIFALGLLLYELASGTNPFAATDIPATLARIVDEDPPLLSEVQPQSVPALDRIIQRCLKKDPAARYRSTHEIIGDLERLRADRAAGRTPVSDAAVGASSPRRSQPRSRQWLVNHQVVMSVVYIGLLWLAWFERGWLGSPWDSVFLLSVLASVAAGTSLRLHLWFTALTFPQQLAEQQASAQRWTRMCDLLLAAVQVAAALGISANHPEFAMLLVGTSVAILVASFVIEPATTRAAFGAVP
jgi:serine/threonine protein kinase